jgi:hypothetical protein
MKNEAIDKCMNGGDCPEFAFGMLHIKYVHMKMIEGELPASSATWSAL